MPRKKLKDFDKLKEQWYKKLKDSGFNDIEKNEYQLKRMSNNAKAFQPNGQIRTGMWTITAEYYRMADHFLHSHEFENEKEKIVWEYHANGMTVLQIAETLKKAKIKQTGRWKVWEIIKKLKQLMFKKSKEEAMGSYYV